MKRNDIRAKMCVTTAVFGMIFNSIFGQEHKNSAGPERKAEKVVDERAGKVVATQGKVEIVMSHYGLGQPGRVFGVHIRGSDGMLACALLVGLNGAKGRALEIESLTTGDSKSAIVNLESQDRKIVMAVRYQDGGGEKSVFFTCQGDYDWKVSPDVSLRDRK